MAGGWERNAVERMLALAVAALHETRPERLWSLAMRELLDSLDGAFGIRKTEEWDEGSGAVQVWTPQGPAEDVFGPPQLEVVRRGYPFAARYAGSADLTPSSAREVAGAARWREGAEAGRIRDALGSTDVLALPLPPAAPTGPGGAGRAGGATVRGCLVHRTGRGPFTAAQLAYAERVQPLLAGVDAHSRHLHAWRRAARPAREGAEREGADRNRADREGAARQGADREGVAPPGAAAAAREARAVELGLTPREITVLLLLGEALPAAAIARRLGISVRTVHKHVAHIYAKFGTSDRLATVLRAQERGVLGAGTGNGGAPG